MTLEKYKRLLEKVQDIAPDERVYQTVVIQPFLEDVFVKSDIQVIDTSWTRETRNHTKAMYTIPSEKGNCGASSDIIISKNYNYYNKNKTNGDTKIYACIDVKISGAKDIPNGVNYIHSCEQMARYLQVVDTAILTNCNECKQPMEFKLNKGEIEIQKLEESILRLTMNESK